MSNEKETIQVFTVEDLTRILGIGKSSAYELVRSGTIRNLRVGKKYLIPKAAVEEYLDSAS